MSLETLALFHPQSLQGIDLGRPSRWQRARRERNCDERYRSRPQCQRIERRNSIEQACQTSRR
jgi:hypothetical protein